MAGVCWPIAEDIGDDVLEARLFPASSARSQPIAHRPMPEWAWIHRELKRPGVTLLLLWGEYRDRHSGALGYSRFCEIYQEWKGRLGSPITSCQASTGSWLVMIVELRSWRSSMISIRSRR
jgi:transposase